MNGGIRELLFYLLVPRTHFLINHPIEGFDYDICMIIIIILIG